MKKINICLVFIFVLLQLSGLVLAANWPNMTTGASSNSGGTSGGGSGYRLSYSDSRTRYTLYNHQTGKNIIVYPAKSRSTNLLGNTYQWFKKDGDNVTGVSNPKVDVGDDLFKALLKKANKEPSDVITTGKNTFTITAEVLVNYTKWDESKDKAVGDRVYLSHAEAVDKGWIDGAYSRLLWRIAIDELRKWWSNGF